MNFFLSAVCVPWMSSVLREDFSLSFNCHLNILHTYTPPIHGISSVLCKEVLAAIENNKKSLYNSESARGLTHSGIGPDLNGTR